MLLMIPGKYGFFEVLFTKAKQEQWQEERIFPCWYCPILRLHNSVLLTA